MNHLQGKVVVITGASSGIGAVSAKALAARGAKIVAASRGREALDQLVADIEKAGGTAVAKVIDVADARDAQALADFVVDTYGTIDVLVNNAGLMLFSYWKDRAGRLEPDDRREHPRLPQRHPRRPAPDAP
jgi:NADP-dependent 3-hydroxy acid dehydrogenase YdfG